MPREPKGEASPPQPGLTPRLFTNESAAKRQLVVTGFHPLDGARHLRAPDGVDERVIRPVANHSFALLEAEERVLRAELAQHRVPEGVQECIAQVWPP